MSVIRGIHHLTAASSDAPRTVDYYTNLLGLRLVKKTVNFDDPESYHLYLSTDEAGSPGTLITFFEWRDLPRGRWGIGSTHHLAFEVAGEEEQLRWKRRITDAGIPVSGPYDRQYFKSIYFTDPDGLIIEIATSGPGFTVDEPEEGLGRSDLMPPGPLMRGNRDEAKIAQTTWPEPVEEIDPGMRLRGIHHITAVASDIERTHEFYAENLGLRLIKRTRNYDDPGAPHWYWSSDPAGRPGTVVTCFGYPAGSMRRSRMGTGLTHHFAFEVEDDLAQREVRERLLGNGVQVTEVLDRRYFRSIYFRDPDGHILEVATRGPGFAVDEPEETLGRELKLPPWLEDRREQIERSLVPL
ncbi:glyoxalase [Rubrobacter taiwanensis]|jgi:glyoxalase family protein|uniref:Glyoxalase n=1 Tax=Rubrobacter taiwanensis TaxID=185139 RepID=A0A4R1BM73_9ACTN|nr:VOC family protein [Rubrobacter taiwanensis]TCJ18446.1 glyoxalase [Rubrobacter taiwanensis]